MHLIPCAVACLLFLLPSAATADARFVWTGTVPAAGMGVLTNPNVSPGESWTLEFEISSALPDSNPSNSAIGIYLDPSLTATISFSGGYSAHVGTPPGMTAEVWRGIGHALATSSVSGELRAWVWQPNPTFPTDAFPPDGTYVTPPSMFAGAWIFNLTNADGEVSYRDVESFVSVTVTTIPMASSPVRVLIAFCLIAMGLGAARRVQASGREQVVARLDRAIELLER